MSPALWFTFTAAEQISLALVVVLVMLVGIMGYRAWRAAQITPAERERRRRVALVRTGKMGDATLMDLKEDNLYYAYLVRGVEYTASQDVSALKEQVPSDLSLLSSVSVRYDPRNPANSIVVAEEWSGLHLAKRT
jgi:hypothetical protein